MKKWIALLSFLATVPCFANQSTQCGGTLSTVDDYDNPKVIEQFNVNLQAQGRRLKGSYFLQTIGQPLSLSTGADELYVYSKFSDAQSKPSTKIEWSEAKYNQSGCNLFDSKQCVATTIQSAAILMNDSNRSTRYRLDFWCKKTF